ncbi:MAG: hypothetical protein LBJ93_01825 [Clostridiales bacterium]|nr:hypothetical protein [Clostridiales bacterium]
MIKRKQKNYYQYDSNARKINNYTYDIEEYKLDIFEDQDKKAKTKTKSKVKLLFVLFVASIFFSLLSNLILCCLINIKNYETIKLQKEFERINSINIALKEEIINPIFRVPDLIPSN